MSARTLSDRGFVLPAKVPATGHPRFDLREDWHALALAKVIRDFLKPELRHTPIVSRHGPEATAIINDAAITDGFETPDGMHDAIRRCRTSYHARKTVAAWIGVHPEALWPHHEAAGKLSASAVLSTTAFEAERDPAQLRQTRIASICCFINSWAKRLMRTVYLRPRDICTYKVHSLSHSDTAFDLPSSQSLQPGLCPDNSGPCLEHKLTTNDLISQLQVKRLWLSAREISDLQLEGLSPIPQSVTTKACKEQWPYKTSPSPNGGRHKLYHLSTLPSVAQIDYLRKMAGKPLDELLIATALANGLAQIGTDTPDATDAIVLPDQSKASVHLAKSLTARGYSVSLPLPGTPASEGRRA